MCQQSAVKCRKKDEIVLKFKTKVSNLTRLQNSAYHRQILVLPAWHVTQGKNYIIPDDEPVSSLILLGHHGQTNLFSAYSKLFLGSL